MLEAKALTGDNEQQYTLNGN